MMSSAQKAAFVKRMQQARPVSLSQARTPAKNVPQHAMDSSKMEVRVGKGMIPGQNY